MQQDVVEGETGQKLPCVAVERLDGAVDSDQILEIEIGDGLDRLESTDAPPGTPAKGVTHFEDVRSGPFPDPLMEQTVDPFENRIKATSPSFECIRHGRWIVDCPDGK